MRYTTVIRKQDTNAVIGGGSAMTLASAIKKAGKAAETIHQGPTRIETYENGDPVIVAFGATVQEAVAMAIAMDKKSRTGGGR